MRRNYRFYRPDGAPAGADPATTQADPAANPEDGTAAASADIGKTYTQDQVNGISAKEAAKAQAKLLKELGVTDLKDVKEGMEALKKLQDQQKTDAEKAQDAAKKAEKERDTLAAELENAKARMTALSKGIPADKIDVYIKMTEAFQSEGGTMEEALDAALKDFPLTPTSPSSPVPGNPGPKPAPPAPLTLQDTISAKINTLFTD